MASRSRLPRVARGAKTREATGRVLSVVLDAPALPEVRTVAFLPSSASSHLSSDSSHPSSAASHLSSAASFRRRNCAVSPARDVTAAAAAAAGRLVGAAAAPEGSL